MKEYICIVCPKGCLLQVDKNNKVTGYKCLKGLDYVNNELLNPKRILTTTIKTNNDDIPRLPVKTNNPIDKDLIFDVKKIINETTINKSYKTGDIIISNILNLNVDIIATKDFNEVIK